MKKGGGFIRALAIILAIVMTCVLVGQYVLSYQELADDQKDLKKSIKEHEATHESKAEMKDCYQCENYEDSKEYYENRAISLILSLVQTLALYMVYCGILFATGVIIGKMSGAKAPAQQVMPVANVCPNCGTVQQPGDRFCAVCGSSFEN